MDTNILKNNGIDYEKGIEILGDIETYNDMLGDFLEEVKEKKENLKKYKKAGDMSNYAIYAHSLKSDSKYFGFTKLIDLALSHEMAGKEGNIDFVNNNYDGLINETNRIISVVEEYLNS